MKGVLQENAANLEAPTSPSCVSILDLVSLTSSRIEFSQKIKRTAKGPLFPHGFGTKVAANPNQQDRKFLSIHVIRHFFMETQKMNKKVVTPTPNSVVHTPFGRSLFARPFFDDFFNQFMTESNGRPFADVMNAAMDVAETERAFVVKLDLPGVAPDEVDIQIDNNTLTIRGQRNEENDEMEEAKQFHRIERTSGSFTRSVVLPSAINEDETVAQCKNGVLTITAPKTEEARPRKISIKG